MTSYFKSIILTLFLFSLFFSCTTVTKNTKKSGFRYLVPQDMQESPDLARRFRYDNFIVEKGKFYLESNILIAIRHSNNERDYSIKIFAEEDQSALRNQVKISYDGKWTPPGFEGKNISFISYQFSYSSNENILYQRSVYIKYNNIAYVVSMFSKDKEYLIHEKNNFFWENITVD